MISNLKENKAENKKS